MIRIQASSTPLTDITPSLHPVPHHPVRRLRATVDQIEWASRDIVRLALTVPGAPLQFSAGQYVLLTFGGRLTRPYSLANQPGARTLEFHISQIDGGATSAYVGKTLRVGEEVDVDGPYGSSYLRPSSRPILLVGGGSGLAPVVSILKTIISQRKRRRIHLYHGVRDLEDIYDGDMLTTAALCHSFAFRPVLLAPTRPTKHRSGLVHEAIAADFTSLDDFEIYVAGPPQMVDAVTETVRRRGVPVSDIYAEPFYSAHRDEAASTQGSVRMGRLGVLATLFRKACDEA